MKHLKGKRVCSVCKGEANFFHDKWYCSHASLFGDMNIVGYCKKKRKLATAKHKKGTLKEI